MCETNVFGKMTGVSVKTKSYLFRFCFWHIAINTAESVPADDMSGGPNESDYVRTSTLHLTLSSPPSSRRLDDLIVDKFSYYIHKYMLNLRKWSVDGANDAISSSVLPHR